MRTVKEQTQLLRKQKFVQLFAPSPEQLAEHYIGQGKSPAEAWKEAREYVHPTLQIDTAQYMRPSELFCDTPESPNAQLPDGTAWRRELDLTLEEISQLQNAGFINAAEQLKVSCHGFFFPIQ